MSVINGTGGADLLIGTSGDDAISGFAGDDTLIGGSGNDTMRGGPGNDLVDGGDGHDNLLSGGGENTLVGGAGDDLLQAFGSRDVLDGGSGFDRAGFFNSPGGVTVDLGIAGPQFTGWETVTLVGIENVSGTILDDKLTGDGGANWLWGSIAGNDTLSGLGGDDLLDIGAGNSVVDGGTGADTLLMDGNGSFSSGVTINLSIQGVTQPTGHGTVVLTSVENVSGSGFADTLSAAAAGHGVSGDDGSDQIGDDDGEDDDGGGHAAGHILAGDLGGDLLVGGAGNDTLLGDGAIGIDAHGVGTSGPITTWLVSPEAPGGADTLVGGRGDDTLVGGGGADVLSGGAGRDHFVFTSLDDSRPDAPDLIVDLENKDVIDLSIIDADSTLAGNQAFHQVSGFTHHAGELVLDYDKASGTSHLSVDVNGDGQADLVINIVGKTANFDILL